MKDTKKNENKVYGNKKELLEQINRYLDFVATYIDNLKIVDYDTAGLPVYSRPKSDDKIVLQFEEILF